MSTITVCDAPACKMRATLRITVESLRSLPPYHSRSADCCDEHAKDFRIDDPDAVLSVASAA